MNWAHRPPPPPPPPRLPWWAGAGVVLAVGVWAWNVTDLIWAAYSERRDLVMVETLLVEVAWVGVVTWLRIADNARR